MILKARRKRAKPLIGLAGFYGYGNFGDELFFHVFKQHLGDVFDIEVVHDQLEKPYFSTPVERRIEKYDAILIGGGDIVQPWGMDQRYFNQAYLGKPVFIAGVGVPIRARSNTRHAEKDWIVEKYRKYFSSESLRFVHARDRQSAEWIESKLAPRVGVIEAPDIVCALDLPAATKPEGPPILGIVTRYRPKDEPDDYRQIKRLCDHAASAGWRIRHIVLGVGDVGRRDFDNAHALDIEGKDLVYSEDLGQLMMSIGECSALASMKFHGTVVATMYGVPSIVLIPTNKNRNFMERIELDGQVSNFESDRLIDVFDGLPSSLDARSVNRLRFESSSMLGMLKASMLEHVPN